MTSEDGTSRIEDDASWAAATLRFRFAPARRREWGSPWPHRIALTGTLLLHVFLVWVLNVTSRVPERAPAPEDDVLEFVLIEAPPPPSPPEPAPETDSPETAQAPSRPVVTPPQPPPRPIRRRRVVRDAPMTAVDVAPSTPDAPKPRLFRGDGGVNVDAELVAKIDAANDAVVEYRLPDLEKSGRFLRPPPVDYEPTSFDKYWVPDEDLLQEWSRKGVREVAFRVPGTRLKVVCAVSVFGMGGCAWGSSDQDRNPRPPPDIPPPGASSADKLAKPEKDAVDPCVALRRARDAARTPAEFEYQVRRAQQQGCL